MNLKRYYRIFTLALLYLCGLFLYLILNNLSSSYKLSQIIHESETIRVIQNIIPTFLKQEKEPPSVSILFGGDMFFDRYIRQISNEKGYDFILSEMTIFLNEFNDVVVNFESPITEFPSRSMGSQLGSINNYLFTSSPNAIETLKKNNISILNLGNNHISNFGREGYKKTIDILSNTPEIHYFGNTQYSTNKTYFIKKYDDLSIGFVNYNQFINDGYERAISDILSIESNVDVLILYAHWDNEYNTLPAKITQERARKFIDLGTDIVMGSHPHVIQTHEIYNGKHIYYSLGNFVFDQYFSPEVKRGQLISIHINPTDKSITLKGYFIDILPSGKTVLTNEVKTYSPAI